MYYKRNSSCLFNTFLNLKKAQTAGYWHMWTHACLNPIAQHYSKRAVDKYCLNSPCSNRVKTWGPLGSFGAKA